MTIGTEERMFIGCFGAVTKERAVRLIRESTPYLDLSMYALAAASLKWLLEIPQEKYLEEIAPYLVDPVVRGKGELEEVIRHLPPGVFVRFRMEG